MSDEILPTDLDWDNAEVREPVITGQHRLAAVAAMNREREQLLAAIAADYDRRRSHWWGRFLLWLLKKTT